ncbi:hypothetical protein B0H13DRAFT_2369767 [Mycena leptocephala]|nr:hypothetical protein B0H13DRAFT_2369767 [Mycena leptocephala]
MSILREGINFAVSSDPPATPIPNSLPNPYLVDENSPPNSQLNPYLVDENGRLVSTLRSRPASGSRSVGSRSVVSRSKKSSSGRARLIYGGPPSAILELGNRRHGVRVPTIDGSYQHPRIRRRPGFRTPRETPLTDNDLYMTETRPPVASSPNPQHECSLCHHIKSHPVSCGHEHCYVCIRKWLKGSWECPTCSVTIMSEPEENPDRELSIALDHPEWVNTSIVNYSWDGLRFPKLIRRLKAL